MAYHENVNPTVVWQSYLILDGSYKGPLHADSEVGEHSNGALRSFQEAHNLPVTGVFDRATATEMASESVELPEEPELVHYQAAGVLIGEETDPEGLLRADGEWGPHSLVVVRYLVENGQERYYLDERFIPPEEAEADPAPAG